MNRSIPRRLGDSRQYRPLSQFARCIADRLWRRGVVQRWASEDELVDYMQQCGLFLGLARLEEWPPVFAELTSTGFFVDEGEAIVLPILSADALRVVATPTAEPSAAEVKRLQDKAFSMHLMRRARKGDARAILARNEEDKPELREAAAAMWAVLEAEYRYPLRARRGGNRGAVTTPEQPAGTVPATATGTAPTTATPSGSLSPSPESAASTADSEREGEIPDARRPTPLPRSVTGLAVTNPTSVTADTGRRSPVPAVDGLDDEALGQLALEGLALGGAQFDTGHETTGEKVRLARVMRERRYTVEDARLAGIELAAIDVKQVFDWAADVVRLQKVDVGFLLASEGRALRLLVTGGRDRERRRHAPSAAAPPEATTAADRPGTVPAQPVAPPSAEMQEFVEASRLHREAARAKRDHGVPIDPAVQARYDAAHAAVQGVRVSQTGTG